MGAENQIELTAHLQLQVTIKPRASENIKYCYTIQVVWMPRILPKVRLNPFPEEPRTTQNSVRVYFSGIPVKSTAFHVLR